MRFVFWLLVSGGLLALAWALVPRLLRALIKRRLGGYRRQANTVDWSKPERLKAPRRVAVIGGGVAGLTAAVTLARRGFEVTVLEANGYLGGKLGSWPVELSRGRTVWVSHGFHAFFPHYFNLNRFLDSLGLRATFRSIGDYVILAPGGEALRFGGLDTTPVFNLLSLMRTGVFGLGDVLKAPGRDLYGIFLEYEHDRTFERYDHLSFADFNRLAKVPPRLEVAFNTFARAFFADEDKLSLAELLKSFHFYYLGQDGGLVYDYPARDYEAAFLAPIRAELARHGAAVRLGVRVGSLVRTGDGYLVDGERFDKVVLAADVVGASQLMSRAVGFDDAVKAPLAQLKPGQRYAVLRVWVDRDVRDDVPVFVITDREEVLDAVTLYHRFEEETQADLAAHGGAAVLELHCYAVPEALTGEQVRAKLLDEVVRFFPELAGFEVKHEVLQVKRDFTAFHVGQYAARPTVETGLPGFACAGDWVKLPFPAMLLECACASGLLAANVFLREEGLREEPVMSVPLRGLMAGMPQPPGRKVLEPGR
jgi:isorenieratene synthase